MMTTEECHRKSEGRQAPRVILTSNLCLPILRTVAGQVTPRAESARGFLFGVRKVGQRLCDSFFEWRQGSRSVFAFPPPTVPQRTRNNGAPSVIWGNPGGEIQGGNPGTDGTFPSFCATGWERLFPAGPGSDWWLCGMADGCDSSFARWGLSVSASYPRLAPWAVLCRRFAAVLCPSFALFSVAASRYSWRVRAAGRRKNAAHGASRG